MGMFLIYFFSWLHIYFIKRKTNINMRKCYSGYCKTFFLNWTEQNFYAIFQYAPEKPPHPCPCHYNFIIFFFCTWNQKSQRCIMRSLQCKFLFKFLFLYPFPKISTVLHEEGEVQISFFLVQGKGQRKDSAFPQGCCNNHNLQ